MTPGAECRKGLLGRAILAKTPIGAGDRLRRHAPLEGSRGWAGLMPTVPVRTNEKSVGATTVTSSLIVTWNRTVGALVVNPARLNGTMGCPKGPVDGTMRRSSTSSCGEAQRERLWIGRLFGARRAVPPRNKPLDQHVPTLPRSSLLATKERTVRRSRQETGGEGGDAPKQASWKTMGFLGTTTEVLRLTEATQRVQKNFRRFRHVRRAALAVTTALRLNWWTFDGGGGTKVPKANVAGDLRLASRFPLEHWP